MSGSTDQFFGRRARIVVALVLLIWIAAVLMASWAGSWRLWGINHLAYLSPSAKWYFLGACLVALLWTIYPGHHPRQSSANLGSLRRHLRGWVGGVIIAVVVAAVGWLLHARVGLLGDGLMRAADAVRIKAPMPSELLPSVVSMVLTRSLPLTWGIDGYAALRVISIVAGASLALGLWLLAPKAKIDRPRFLIFWLLTFGSSRLFAGYIETYAPAVAATALWTLASLAYIRGNGKAITVAVFWCLAVLSHAMAFALTPAALFVLGFGRAAKAPDWRRLQAFAGVAVVLGLYIGINMHSLQMGGAGTEVGHFLLPVFPQPPHEYGIISAAHFLDFLNQLLLLAPVLTVAAAASVLLRLRRRSNRGKERLSIWSTSLEGRFWLLATILPVAAGFLLDPKLGWARDWDLFTIFFTPALVGGAIWLAGITSLPIRRAAASVAVLSLSLWMAFSVDADAERERFEALLKLDPSRADYGHEILALYYREQGRTLNEIAHYRKALKVTDNIRYRANVAAGYMRVDQAEEAREWYEGILARDSTYDAAVYGMALALHRLGRSEEARPYAERALAADAQDPDRRFTLAAIQMTVDDFDSALPHLEFCARRDPREPKVLNLLGGCYLELGRYHEARAALQQTLRLDSALTLAYLLFARLELATQHYGESRRLLGEYERRVPRDERHPTVQDLADSLSRIRPRS